MLFAFLGIIHTFDYPNAKQYNRAKRKQEVKKVDKDKLIAALSALQDGTKDAGYFHDELETLIALVINAKDEDIAAAWEDVHTDTQEIE